MDQTSRRRRPTYFGWCIALLLRGRCGAVRGRLLERARRLHFALFENVVGEIQTAYISVPAHRPCLGRLTSSHAGHSSSSLQQSISPIRRTSA